MLKAPRLSRPQPTVQPRRFFVAFKQPCVSNTTTYQPAAKLHRKSGLLVAPRLPTHTVCSCSIAAAAMKPMVSRLPKRYLLKRTFLGIRAGIAALYTCAFTPLLGLVPIIPASLLVYAGAEVWFYFKTCRKKYATLNTIPVPTLGSVSRYVVTATWPIPFELIMLGFVRVCPGYVCCLPWEAHFLMHTIQHVLKGAMPLNVACTLSRQKHAEHKLSRD